MAKPSSRTLQITRRAAALRLRGLIDEFHMLTGSFPDLRDAFDPDELPIEFILQRDSHPEPYASPRNPVRSAAAPGIRNLHAHGVEHRGRQRKPASDD